LTRLRLENKKMKQILESIIKAQKKKTAQAASSLK
jgi:regulator of replication initiation timing